MRAQIFMLMAGVVLVGCTGSGATTSDAADGRSSDLPASYQDLPPPDLRPSFDVNPGGPPSLLGLWAYRSGTNHLACAEQDASDDPSTGELFISPATDDGLDVDDDGCHVHFAINGNVASVSPPVQECGSNSTPANWTLTLLDDGTLREDVSGSIMVANVSCFIQGASILTRQW
jgi:hypothetical protein